MDAGSDKEQEEEQSTVDESEYEEDQQQQSPRLLSPQHRIFILYEDQKVPLDIHLSWSVGEATKMAKQALVARRLVGDDVTGYLHFEGASLKDFQSLQSVGVEMGSVLEMEAF